MVDSRVFKAKFLPRIMSPAKNNNHVMMVMSISTFKKSKGRSMLSTIDRPETPPVTMFIGKMNTAVPNASISVPRIMSDIFLIV